MDLATLGIFVTATGAIVALNQFTGAANKAGAAGKSLEVISRRLQATLGTFGFYFGVRQLVEYSDTWKLINSRINLVSGSTENTIAIQQRLFEIANRTRNTMDATSVLYTRLSLNAGELGRTHNELLKVVESVNSAMLISGATGVEAAQGMRQLAQALGAGRLQGDEFRTVMEAMPEVARAISEQLGVARGELYKLSREGKISTNTIIDALLAQHDALVKSAAEMPMTIGQAFTVFSNTAMRFIAILNNITGLNSKAADSISRLGSSLAQMTALLFGAATAFIVYKAAVVGATIAITLYNLAFAGPAAVKAWLIGIKLVYQLAGALAVLKIVAFGVAGALAVAGAAAVGFAAYRAIMAQMQVEMDKMMNAQGDLNKIIGTAADKAEEASRKEKARQRTLMDYRSELAEVVRESEQAAEMAKYQGMAQDVLGIAYERHNKLLELNANLQERVTSGTITHADAIAIMKEATEAQTTAERNYVLALQRRADLTVGNEAIDVAREMQQQVKLAGMTGQAADEERIAQAGINKAILARRELIGGTLVKALETIDLETRFQLLALRTNNILDARVRAEDQQRNLGQELELTSKLGLEHAKLKNHFEAVNKAVIARRTYVGDALAVELMSIQAEEKINDLLITTGQLTSDIAASFADLFENVLHDGIARFTDLFDTIKNLFYRMLAEILASRLMAKVGTRFAAALSAVFASGVPATVSAETASAISSAASKAAGGAVPVRIEAINVVAKQSLMSLFAQAIGPAVAGFSVGSMVGSHTSNRGLGTGGGMLAGAALGAIMGSVVPVIGTAFGAAVGGLAGAIGGGIASTRNHTEELRRHLEVLKANNLRLRELKDGIAGVTAASRLSDAGRLAGQFAKTKLSAWDFLDSEELRKSYTYLQQVAADLGITLDGSKKSYEQLQEAIKLAIIAVTQFGNNLTDIQKKQEAYNKIFDIVDTPQQRLEDNYAILKQTIPDLLRMFGLDHLDLKTEEGRNALREGFKEIYNLILSGQLTPELLGAFTDKNALLDAIMKTIDAFGNLDKELTKVSTDFPRAMDIVYYEQKFGRYGAGYHDEPHHKGPVSGGIYINGDVHITTSGKETGEEVLDKVEKAALARGNRGGFVNMPMRPS